MGQIISALIVGVGLERAGNNIANGMRDASSNIGNGIDVAATRASNAMIISSQTIAKAGLEATDLASKRISLSLLESTMLISNSMERVQIRFNEANVGLLNTFLNRFDSISNKALNDLDLISEKRVMQVGELLKDALKTFSDESADWRQCVNEIQKKSIKIIIPATILHATFIGLFIILSSIIHATLTTERGALIIIENFKSVIFWISNLILSAIVAWFIFTVIKKYYYFKALQHSNKSLSDISKKLKELECEKRIKRLEYICSTNLGIIIDSNLNNW